MRRPTNRPPRGELSVPSGELSVPNGELSVPIGELSVPSARLSVAVAVALRVFSSPYLSKLERSNAHIRYGLVANIGMVVVLSWTNKIACPNLFLSFISSV